MKMITNTMLLAGCLALGNICAVQASGNGPRSDLTLCGTAQRANMMNLSIPDMDNSSYGNPASLDDNPLRRLDCSNLQRMASLVELGHQLPPALQNYTKTFLSEEECGKFIEDTIETAITTDEEIIELLTEGEMKVLTSHPWKKNFSKRLDTLVKEAIDNAGWKRKFRLTKPFINDYPSLKVGEVLKTLKVGEEVTVLKTNTDDWSVDIQIEDNQEDQMLLKCLRKNRTCDRKPNVRKMIDQRLLKYLRKNPSRKPKTKHVMPEVWEKHFQPQGFNGFDIKKLNQMWSKFDDFKKQKFDDLNIKWKQKFDDFKKKISESVRKQIGRIKKAAANWKEGKRVTLRNDLKIIVGGSTFVPDDGKDRVFIVQEPVGLDMVRVYHEKTGPEIECTVGMIMFERK